MNPLEIVLKSLEKMSDEELLSFHKELHGEINIDENASGSPIREVIELLDALANLLRRFI